MKAVGKLRGEFVEDLRRIAKACEKQNGGAMAAPINVMELYAVDGNEAAHWRLRLCWARRGALR